MRRLATSLTLLAVLASAATAAASGPIYRTGGNCINPDPSGFGPPAGAPLPMPGQPWEVLSEASRSAAAGALIQRMTSTSMFGEMSARFRLGLGRPATTLPPPNGRPRFQIFVAAPDALSRFGAGGVQDVYCGHAGSTAIVIAHDGAEQLAGYVTAHELAHAFQSGAAGRPSMAGWFNEMAAEYAATTIWGFPTETYSPEFDRGFLSRPDLPLDRFAYDPRAPREERGHPYGAYRLLQWLGLRTGGDESPTVWRIIAQVARRTGTTADQLRLAKAEWRDAGRDLGRDLGRFWADHLHVTPNNGAAARVISKHIGSGSPSQVTTIRRWAARLNRFTVAPGIRRVQITITPRDPGQLWIEDERGLRKVTGTYRGSWCVGSEGPGDPRWPGQVGMAFTNPSEEDNSIRVTTVGRERAGDCGPETPVACATQEGGTCRDPGTPAPPPIGIDTTIRDRPCPGEGNYQTSLAPLPDPRLTDLYVGVDILCLGRSGEPEVNGFGGWMRCDDGRTIEFGPPGGRIRVGQMLEGTVARFAVPTSAGAMNVVLTAGAGVVTVDLYLGGCRIVSTTPTLVGP